jgi:hypothetical protein
MRYSRHVTPTRRQQTTFLASPVEVRLLETLRQGRAFGCPTSKGLVIRAALQLLDQVVTRKGPVALPGGQR